MNWVIGILRKIVGFLTDIADSIWKSINNRYKNPDGKIANVDTVKKIGKIMLAMFVIGILYRMLTNKSDLSIFDKYNTENKPPFEVGKTIGSDSSSAAFKSETERTLREISEDSTKTSNGQLTSTIGTTGLLGLKPEDANKFSCDELVKKIQRGEGLTSAERVFFQSCMDKNLLAAPEGASNIYQQISNENSELTPTKAKNAIDAAVDGDEKTKQVLSIANKGITAPTGSQEKETALNILEGLKSLFPKSKEKIIELASQGNLDEVNKIVQQDIKKNPVVNQITDSVNTGASNSSNVNPSNINPSNGNLENTSTGNSPAADLATQEKVEAERIIREKKLAEEELVRANKELDQKVASLKDKDATNKIEQSKNLFLSLPTSEAEAKCLLTFPKESWLCKLFLKQAEAKTKLKDASEKELSFVKKKGKDPFTYLHANNSANKSAPINGVRFIAPEQDEIAQGDVTPKVFSKRLVDPDIYKTRKLLSKRKDLRENANSLGEGDGDGQQPEMKVSDALFFSSTDTKGILFPVNVKVPAVLADTIYVSDQNLGDKPVHLKITADVFNPKNNKILVHKGAVLSGRAVSLDPETKTLTVGFNKITDGPESDEVSLSVSIRGEAWDTKGKQITGAILVDYASSVLEKINSDTKTNLSASDQALLDVISQSNVTAATTAVQKIAQQLASDLQNAKKLFFAPEGSRVIIYP